MLLDFLAAFGSIKVWEIESEDCISPEPIKRQTFKPLSPEAYALGKKPYLGPVGTNTHKNRRVKKC